MEVDSRHPSIVESEYVESVSEEMFTSVPAAEQQAAVLIQHYCERNFEMVVGNSFGFMPAFVHMPNEPVCNFWFNATSGSVSSIPQSTYLLHGTGVIQVCAVNVLSSRPAFDVQFVFSRVFSQTPTLATIFTKIYELKYLTGTLVGNQMVAEGSTNHLVGVVGAYPIAETFRHINAFIRGCVEVDPLCRVAVVWTMTWHNEYIERWAGASEGIRRHVPQKSYDVHRINVPTPHAALKLWVEDGARVIIQGNPAFHVLGGVLVTNSVARRDRFHRAAKSFSSERSGTLLRRGDGLR